MIRLSKKGWNNVLIFSMLLMIFLFNGLHHRLMSNMDEHEVVPLLPANASILTLELANQITVERIGPSWRSDHADMNAQQLQQWMNMWQQLQGIALPAPENPAPGYMFTLQLAGVEQPMVVEVMLANEEVWLHDLNDQRWLQVTNIAPELIVPAVLQ